MKQTISAIRSIILWLAIVVVVATGLRLSGDTFWQYIFVFGQYVFFLRSPLFMAALLLALPTIAEFILPSMLKNLFVLRGKWQMAFTILGATVAGMSVVLVAAIIIENAPARFGVEALTEISPLISQSCLLAMFLALPTTFAVTDLSAEEIGNKRWQGLFLGISFSSIFLFLFDWTRNFLAINNSSNPFVVDLVSGLNRSLVDVISWLGIKHTKGYIYSGKLTDEHFDAFIFFFLLLIVYLLIFQIFKPTSKPSNKKPEAAALLYVMLLISITTLFFGNLTFYFDYWRFSVLFFLLLISVLMYSLFNVDHYFELKEDPLQPNEPTDFLKLVEKRLQKDTLVVVCASGGGIQAAGWTAQVLTGLQADDCLGKSFTKAIGLISSVSGGSIGTMYYLDRFSNKGFPEDTESEQIVNSATADSLDAVGWGLAYPDFWRIISLPMLPEIFTPQISDRGIALETDWQGEMKTPNDPKTLAKWREEILEGKIPIPVFNATIVENGFRLLITPMNFGKSEEKKFFDFNNLYPGYDINLVTAARLSATFPYVSPLCREDIDIDKNYHVADGGYFDNSGFVTAVEWLNKLLEESQKSQEKKIKRVLILQINPFPKATCASQAQKNRGLFMATLGPLLTIFKVRDPIFNARNLTEVELLQQKWQQVSKACEEQEIDIQYFPIHFPNQEEAPNFYNRQGEYRPPLSWKLTQKEKQAIKDGWDAIKGKGKIQELKTLWKDTWKID